MNAVNSPTSLGIGNTNQRIGHFARNRAQASKKSDWSPELLRLINAAVANPKFCDRLIRNPVAALKQGFYDRVFVVTQREYDALISTRGSSLAEFVARLIEKLDLRSEQVLE